MEEIMREKLITDTEAKGVLTERKKEIELGYEQKNALSYLKKYNELTAKKATELMKKLREVKKLRERQIIAIVNLLPTDNDDLRLILEKDYNILTDEEKTLILESVKKFI
jgi:DNA-directed RNA polymerase subunit F